MRAINLICAVLACLMLLPGVARGEESPLAQAKAAFEKGEYTRAIEILKSAAASEPNDGDVYVLLARSYLELNQYDAAVNSAEKAVAINPKNSDYHRWLGEAYGAKADHASMLSAYSLARKTQKEFDAAVQLDAHNFDAQQDLIQYDCTAPGMVGGGEEKALPLIEKLMKMDAAEGHYATGICRAQKKDQECGEASGGSGGRGRTRAAGSPREVLRGRGVDSAKPEAGRCGKIVARLPATGAYELRLSASVGRTLLARAFAGEPEESRRGAHGISGRVEIERQVQAGPGSAEAARARLIEVFSERKCTYAKQSRWPWTPCAQTKCAPC